MLWKKEKRKKLAQMELNHQKEIAELKRLKTDYLQKKIDLEKTIFEANSKNEGKTFDESTVSLNENEKSAFANILKQTVARQGNDISVSIKKYCQNIKVIQKNVLLYNRNLNRKEKH